ncbi:MAG: DUF3391 domain-containing protein [Pseudomonadota bacterium]
MDKKTNKPYQPVPVSELEIGMFVAKLDRPWSDTPFRFEGFEILSNSEIELLADHCDFVYVDASFTSTSSTARHAARRRRGDDVGTSSESLELLSLQRVHLAQALSQDAPHEYQTPVKIRQEAPQAREAFAHAREGTQTLMQALKARRAVEARHVRGIMEPVLHSIARNPDPMVWLANQAKAQSGTVDRQVGTAIWLAVMGRYLELSPPLLLDIAAGGLLLDLGMTRMAASLRDVSRSYSGKQRVAVRAHVRLGLELLDGITGVTERVRLMVAQHQERMDGSGYPAGLAKDEISMFGAVAAVADCYDAMISELPYSPARSTGDAITELNRLSGETFSGLVVEQFVQALGWFPCGSIVELNTGDIAVVAAQNPEHRLRPHLLVVAGKDRQRLPSAKSLKLSQFETDQSRDDAIWIVKSFPFGSLAFDIHQYFAA